MTSPDRPDAFPSPEDFDAWLGALEAKRKVSPQGRFLAVATENGKWPELGGPQKLVGASTNNRLRGQSPLFKVDTGQPSTFSLNEVPGSVEYGQRTALPEPILTHAGDFLFILGEKVMPSFEEELEQEAFGDYSVIQFPAATGRRESAALLMNVGTYNMFRKALLDRLIERLNLNAEQYKTMAQLKALDPPQAHIDSQAAFDQLEEMSDVAQFGRTLTLDDHDLLTDGYLLDEGYLLWVFIVACNREHVRQEGRSESEGAEDDALRRYWEQWQEEDHPHHQSMPFDRFKAMVKNIFERS